MTEELVHIRESLNLAHIRESLNVEHIRESLNVAKSKQYEVNKLRRLISGWKK